LLLCTGAILADRWFPLLMALLSLLLCWKVARLSFQEHGVLTATLAFMVLGSLFTQSIFYGTFRAATTTTVLFECTSADTPLVGRLAVTWDGIAHGGIIATRLAILLLAAALLPLTTHPADFMLSLVKLKVPFVFVLVFTLGLRFFPLLQRNLLQILDAQRLRGIRPLSLAGIRRTVTSPTWSTLRTANRLALSLETRAYRPSAGRTYYRELRPGVGDLCLLLASLVLFLFLLFFPHIDSMGPVGPPQWTPSTAMNQPLANLQMAEVGVGRQDPRADAWARSKRCDAPSDTSGPPIGPTKRSGIRRIRVPSMKSLTADPRTSSKLLVFVLPSFECPSSGRWRPTASPQSCHDEETSR